MHFVLEMIELICMRQTVLFLISFEWLICLITYGKYRPFLRRSLSERDLSPLHWVTHLFYSTCIYNEWHTFMFSTCIYISVLIPCLSLICEISPKLLFISRMPTDSEQEMANAYTKWPMPTRTPATLPKTARNSTFAALKRVILEMNNIHPRAD